ncbi:hypothetical protein VPNG_04592 [Cytospora leucostoma]|uniref:Rab proteins geranylgeranyltransferase n=1 Tax=Cytospora leucostoma TaxID=1230097 RepID=A0A423XCN4_9PEZI|nr:hypothetical protein VPNG_04592 [Cytospora leucostoma]
MESLSETTWDVIICGTGLQQSLLALALSRSDKKILHLDPNEYYGGAEAAFSLQEADAWASEIAKAPASSSIFSSAAVTSKPADGADSDIKLSSPRSYALSLSPQLIHAGSKLLSQLVSSRAYRQLEFLAVGSFFVYKPSSSDPSVGPRLARIPSTREDVFSSTDLPARAKRQLMKFLKLVLSYQEETSLPQWQEYSDRPLAEFLTEKMGLDADLRTYITTLTLSLDGQVSTEVGLATIHRHLTSMGMFGPGFAAVYPKWGGGSEIAQVACRAGAVGGGIYMLGTGIKEVRGDGSGEEVEVELSDGTVVKTKSLVRGSEEIPAGPATKVSRLIAITGSPLPSLFETTMEGAPTPAVAVVALPSGSVKTDGGIESKHPIYAIVHSSDTGECPSGQSILYLSSITTPESKALLESSVDSLLAAIDTKDAPKPHVLHRLYYEQQCNDDLALAGEKRIFKFPPPPAALTFDDASLETVYEAWKKVLGGDDTPEETLAEYMVFADREGVADDDDYE